MALGPGAARAELAHQIGERFGAARLADLVQ
jgi:hypothetical protein